MLSNSIVLENRNMSFTLCTMDISVFLKTLITELIFPGPKKNAAFWKPRVPGFLVISVQANCRKLEADILVDQKKLGSLLSKRSLNSNRLQTCSGNQLVMKFFKLYKVFKDLKCGAVVVIFHIDEFQKSRAESEHETGPLALSVLLETPLLKAIGSPCMTPTNFKSFDRQLQLEMKDFVKDSEDIGRSTDEPVSPRAKDNDAESRTSDPLVDETSMESPENCSACRECIRKKEFFADRRFGILENCDCVICYGCIRRHTGASIVVPKGPIWCPLCLVKSDKVASNHSWIGAEEKVEFFKEYCQNVKTTSMKLRLGWTCFPTRKGNVHTSVPKMVPVN